MRALACLRWRRWPAARRRLSSRVASLPEIVGDVGLLFDPHDTAAIAQALKKALTDSAWRERQSQAGLERAKTFSWKTTADIVQKSYETALG